MLLGFPIPVCLRELRCGREAVLRVNFEPDRQEPALPQNPGRAEARSHRPMRSSDTTLVNLLCSMDQPAQLDRDQNCPQ
jgi:hypothetical protein